MYDIITIGRKLIADIAARDVEAVLRGIGDMSPKLADLYRVITTGSILFGADPAQRAEFLAVCDELTAAVESWKQEPPVFASNAVGSLNLVAVLAVAEAVANLLNLIKGLL